MESRAADPDASLAAALEQEAADLSMSQILNAPGRYASDIQGELVVASRPGGRATAPATRLSLGGADDDFEALFARYSGAAHHPAGSSGGHHLPAAAGVLAGHQYPGFCDSSRTPSLPQLFPPLHAPGPGFAAAPRPGYPWLDAFGARLPDAGPPAAAYPTMPQYAREGALGHAFAPQLQPRAPYPCGPLSDGELSRHDGAGGDLSDGELAEDTPDLRRADVVAVVKERVGRVLQLKNPKLLQGPQFRAMMLLLKVAKLDDPDAILAQIKGAPLAVASELNALAHEFCLDMVVDACVAAILTAASAKPPAKSPPDAAMRPSGGSPAPPASTPLSPELGVSDGVDMDTSSDHDGYEGVSPELGPQPTRQGSLPPLEPGELPSLREHTPQPDPRFDRSRAPSPPSAHPKALQAPMRPTPLPTTPSGTNSGAGEATNPPSPQKPRRALQDPGSAVCSHENDRFVVFVDESDSSSGSSSGSESDTEGSTPRVRSAPSLPALGSGFRADAAGSPSGDLLRAKESLKEKEAAIARLKSQINQRQMRALLRRKLQIAHAQKAAAAAAAAASASVTETTETPSPPVLSTPVQDAAVGSAGPSPQDTAPLAQQAVRLPVSDHLAAVLGRMPEAARSKHAAAALARLDDALEAKRAALRLRIRRIQAEADLAQAELALVEYAIHADREAQAIAGSAEPLRHPSTQAKSLETDVGEIARLREAICSIAQLSLSPARTPTAPAAALPESSRGGPQTEPEAASAQLKPRPAVDAARTQAQPRLSPAEMRAKLVAMKKDQSEISQKLAVLAVKRKQEQQAAPPPLQPEASPASKKQKGPPDTASMSTNVDRVYDALTSAVEACIGPYEKWCASALAVLDSHALQPLVAIDGIVKTIPSPHASVLRKYLADMRQALGVLSTADRQKGISNARIAKMLRPVWARYRPFFATCIAADSPLRSVLVADKPDPVETVSVPHDEYLANDITRKERVFIARLVGTEHSADMPIMNQCVLHVPAPPTRASTPDRAFRYFDLAASKPGIVPPPAAAAAADPSSAGGSSSAPDSPAAAYSAAVQEYWNGIQNATRPVMEHEVYNYLRARTNKDVGRVIKSLKSAIQRWPGSERLWDLYLELYSRQRVPPEEVVAAFADATKFHPHSTCIWRRYVVWCGWCAQQKKAHGSAEASQIRLSMVAAMAVQVLAGTPEPDRAGTTSATIAEILIHYWDCLWQSIELLVPPALPAARHQATTRAVSRVLAHMHACLTAGTLSELVAEISSMRVLATPAGAHKPPAAAAAHPSAWALSELLLPHHLLAVAQVYASCFIDTEYVPRLVLDGLYAALHAKGDHQAVYFIDLDRVVQRGPGGRKAPNPQVTGMLCKLLGRMLSSLQQQRTPRQAAMADAETLSGSRELCLTSIKATLAQLQQYSPVDVEPRLAECEEIFWTTRYAPADSAGFQRVPDMMAETGACRFLLVAQAVCAGAFPGDAAQAAQVAELLHRHATTIANDIRTIDTPAAEPPAAGSTRERIEDTRRLYYRIVGYTGTGRPADAEELSQRLQHAPDAGDNAQLFYNRIRKTAGVWTNIALVELLHASHCANTAQQTDQAAQAAQAWLRFGLRCLPASMAGGRAQIWALLLRLTMVQRPLKPEEIAEMGRDLTQPRDASPLQVAPQCYLLVNLVMRAVLNGAPTDETLGAIAAYLAREARANAETAISMVRSMSFVDLD
ncbi:hypothetical protein H4R18_001496 [Coemansia javaensis]|uniref:Uncharacterized protein n=1 Tax=Coemansia javaensis TaxID=2761396 RepID=A0A9W8HKH1_9FUNG|nr:hypothetical protein H4R18_001496 [Coemansia javaensis]